MGHDATIASLAYHPDGAILASASEDGTLRLWSEVGEELAMIEVDSRATSLAFSADGEWLFAAHANTTCSRYRVADFVRE